MEQPAFAGAKVRIMPDVHYGTGCVVGFTATAGDKMIPNVPGVDLGCGMYTAEIGRAEFSLSALDDHSQRFAQSRTAGGKNLSENGGRKL